MSTKRLTVNRVGTDKGAQAPASTPAEDVVSAVLGLVIVGAVYADGRAHVLELPDTFFTPWHSFLYGGLLLLIGWLAVMSRRAAVRTGDGRFAVIPRGYGFAVVGAGIFALGGAADMVWHQIFGIEFGIEALLSPTHLLLFGGGSLLISGPLRSLSTDSGLPDADSRPAGMGFPAVLSVLGMTAIAAFAFAFLSGFLSDAAASVVLPEGAQDHLLSEELAATGLASYVITSLILVIPITFLMTSRLARPGVITLLVASLGLLASVLENFQSVAIILAALVSGVVVDAVLALLRARGVRERTQKLVVAAVIPIAVWSGQLVALDATVAVQWSVAMVTGVVALSALSSVVVVGVLGRRQAAR